MQVDAGATFFVCDTVTGFPKPTGDYPFINRQGASSFIAVKKTATGKQKVWINASVGAWRIRDTFVSDWEYQIRYYSGDPDKNEAAKITVGTIPNANVYPANQATGSAQLQFDDLPDLTGVINDEFVEFANGYGSGALGTISVLITNSGPGKAIGPFEVTFYVSSDGKLDRPGDAVVSLATFSGELAPGASAIVTSNPFQIPVAFPEPTFHFLAAIDVADRISESNKDNNLALAQPKISDLVPRIETVSFADLRPGRSGEVVLLLRNSGRSPLTGTATVETFIRSDSRQTVEPCATPQAITISNLAAGAELRRQIPVTLPANLVPSQSFEDPFSLECVVTVAPPDSDLDKGNNRTHSEAFLVKGFVITGQVLTKYNSKPIMNAKVALLTSGYQTLHTKTTDATGSFQIPVDLQGYFGVANGEYVVTAQKPDWQFYRTTAQGDSPINVALRDVKIDGDDMALPPFFGTMPLTIETAKTSYEGTPVSIEGVSHSEPLTIEVNWGSHTPGKFLLAWENS